MIETHRIRTTNKNEKKRKNDFLKTLRHDKTL